MDGVVDVQAIIDAIGDLNGPEGVPDRLARLIPSGQEIGDLSQLFWEAASHLESQARPALADALLWQAVLHNERQISTALIRYSEAARDRSDWPEMARRAGLIRARFPNLPHGYLEEAFALQQSGQLAAADATLTAAVETFPSDQTVLTNFVELAHHRRAWTDLFHRAHLFRNAFPQHIFGPLMLATAQIEAGHLPEADETLADAVSRHPDNRRMLALWIGVALRSRAWEETFTRCKLAQERFPDTPFGYTEAAVATRERGKLEEADTLFSAAVERFPHDFASHVHWADISVRRENLNEADRRWQTTTQRFPDNDYPVRARARVLISLQRHQEADRLLEEFVAKQPHNESAFQEWAEYAVRGHNWPEALRRGALLLQTFPKSFAGAAVVATALREQGRIEEAINLLLPLAVLPAADLRCLEILFDCLMRTHRFSDARNIVERILELRPNAHELVRQYIRAAVSMSRGDDAMAVWRVLADRSDANSALVLDLAWTILSTSAQPEAARVLLHKLCEEPDTGARDWLPRIAGLERLFHVRPELADIGRLVVAENDLTGVDQVTLLVLKALVQVERDDAETLFCFETFLRPGRANIVACLFSNAYCSRTPERMTRTIALFETWIDAYLANPTDIDASNSNSLLLCLSFAAVYSHASFRRLARTASTRFDLDALADADNWTTAKGCVSSILRGTGQIAAPSVVKLDRPLKIAICVSGQLRGFRQAFPSWAQFGFGTHDVKLFVHSWFDVGRNWSRFWAFTQRDTLVWDRLNVNDVIETLRDRFPRVANACHAGGFVTEDELRAFYRTEHVRLEDDRKPPLRDMPISWKMHKKIESAFDLAMEGGEEFDLIIRIRPDLEAVSYTNADWHNVLDVSRSERLLFTDIVLNYGVGRLAVGDQFAVGTQDVMTIYSTIFSEHMRRCDNDAVPVDLHRGLDNHRSMAYYTLYQGILTKKVPDLNLGGLLDPVLVRPAELLPLAIQDIAERPADEFDRRFVAALEGL